MLCRHLLPGFSTDLDQIAHVQYIGTRGCNCENGIWKFQSVAMEMRKFSHWAPICLMVLNFSMKGACGHNNVHAKNWQNLPHGFGDIAYSNRLVIRVRQRLWSFMMSLVTSSVTTWGVKSNATSSWHPAGWSRAPEYAKFWIFQIGRLLREIWPFLWSHVFPLWQLSTQLTRAPREGQGPSIIYNI